MSNTPISDYYCARLAALREQSERTEREAAKALARLKAACTDYAKHCDTIDRLLAD